MGTCCGDSKDKKDKNGRLYCSAEETTVTSVTKKFGNACCEMPRGALRYVGERYITKFADPIEWDSARAYEQIEAVQHEGFTYISKQPVPAGVQIDNEEFWLLWADPNAQMEQLRQTVENYKEDVEETASQLESEMEVLSEEVRETAKTKRNMLKSLFTGCLIGHRGVNGSAPGNTRASFEYAGKWGYKAVELDVQRTLNGVYVCHHGQNMSEDTAQSMLIKEYDYATLAAIPYTKGKNVDQFPTQYLPTLDEVLKIIKAYGMVPVIELKQETIETQEHIEDIMNIVKKNGLYENCAFVSFNATRCMEVRELNPFAVILITGNNLGANTINWCVENDIDGISIKSENLTQEQVDNAHNAGLIVGGWYTVAPGEAFRALDKGCDCLFIDDICEMQRPDNATTGILRYGEGGYVNGVPTVSQHEYIAASSNRFTNYIYRTPLVFDEYGNRQCIKRTGNNLAYCGTIPRTMQVGSVIKFKQNPYYCYSVQVASMNNAAFNDSGEVNPEGGDKFIVVPLRDVIDPDTAIVSITAWRNGLPYEYNSEYMFDDAAKYIEYLEPLEIMFKATSGVIPPSFNQQKALNRVTSRLYDINPGYAIPIAFDDVMSVKVDTYKDGAFVSSSDWITASTPGYNETDGTYTPSGDFNQILFGWKAPSGNIGVDRLYKCFEMLGVDIEGLTFR